MLLKIGKKGKSVTYVQYALFILEYYIKKVDGFFGEETQAAVKKYQSDFGLTTDGIVGNMTWNSLKIEIEELQEALLQQNALSSKVDGIAGPVTFAALKEFQKNRSIQVTGKLDTITRRVLFQKSSKVSLPLKKGSQGKYVTVLQYGLYSLCCSPGEMDGRFGNKVLSAVKRFQKRYSLTIDGIVGKNTWSELITQVKKIQTALKDKGFGVENIDGYGGPFTYNKIIEFQRSVNLEEDGIVGPATREALFGTTKEETRDTFPLSIGSQGTWVLYLQNAVTILNFALANHDGVFEHSTENAVKKFQSEKKITTDGIVGPVTWAALVATIKPIQQALKNKGFYTGLIDGVAGEETMQGVMEYQEKQGLTKDGSFSVAERNKLTENIVVHSQTSSNQTTVTVVTTGATSVTIQQGSNGSYVKYMQRIMKVLGYTIDIDGSFGTQTKRVISSFQEKNNLTANGIVNAVTWEKIFASYAVPVKGSGTDKFIAIAKHELNWGYREDNSNNISPYGQRYGINPGQWCAMFVSWCAYYANISSIPQYSYTPTGANWFKQRGIYYKRTKTYTPSIGDVVFFYNKSLGRIGHTGIVIGVNKTGITTIEGNSTDKVCKHYYDFDDNYIDGYGKNNSTVSV